MLNMSQAWDTNIKKPARECCARVKVYNGSTLAYTFLPEDKLVSFKISKLSSPKMFGFSICQMLELELIDKDGNVNLQKGYKVKCELGVEDEYAPTPNFYIDSVEEKDTIRKISVKAYDIVHTFDNKTFSQLTINYPRTLKQIATQIAGTVQWDNNLYNPTYDGSTSYLNYNPQDTQRTMIDDICGASGAICFAGYNDDLVFKRIEVSTPALTIDRSDYFSFTTGDDGTITGLVSATELGDNVEVGSRTGRYEVLRENGCLTTNNNIATHLNSLLVKVNGLHLYAYDLKWRGNPALEIGDTVKIQKKDDSYITTIYLGETIKYNGGISSQSTYDLGEQEDPEANPANIGEAISQTIARVDKINKTIDLKVEEAIDGSQTIAELSVSVGNISSHVAEMDGDIATIQSTITQMPGEIKLAVESDLQDDFYQKCSSIDITEDGIEVKSTGGITIDSGADLTISSGADLTISSGASLVINSGNLTIDSSGNVKVKGAIQSGSTISGATITGGSISIGSGAFKVNSNGSVDACSGNFQILSGTGAMGEYVASCGGGFLVDGNLACDSINIYGGGGSWYINSDGTCGGLKAIAVFGA